MASILQVVISKGITSLKSQDAVSRLKTVANNVMLYVGLIGYTAIGAKIFQWLELPSELERLEMNQALLLTNRVIFLETIVNNTRLEDAEYHELVSSALDSYEGVISEASGAGVDVVSKEFSINWDYTQATFFSLTILTTIGYGNFATETFGGRLFCLVFGIIGIPFMLSVLANIGSLMAEGLEYVWSANKIRIKRIGKFFRRLRKRKTKKTKTKVPVTDEENNETEVDGDKPGDNDNEESEDEEDEEEDDEISSSAGILGNILTFVGTVATLGAFFALGALLLTCFEEWSFFDAFYFCFITSTTIGFGDLTPSIAGEDKGFYMIICTVYIFLGLAFTSTIIEIVRRQMVENLRKMQELRAQIQAQVKLAETLKKLSDNAATQNIDIGVNISEDLEQLKSNLNKFKKSNMGGSLLDMDIQLDWVEDNNKKVKAFIIYESSV